MGTVGSHAPVAFNNSGGGKGESYWIAQYDDVIAATLRAGKALALELNEEKIEKIEHFFVLMTLMQEESIYSSSVAQIQ